MDDATIPLAPSFSRRFVFLSSVGIADPATLTKEVGEAACLRPLEYLESVAFEGGFIVVSVCRDRSPEDAMLSVAQWLATNPLAAGRALVDAAGHEPVALIRGLYLAFVEATRVALSRRVSPGPVDRLVTDSFLRAVVYFAGGLS